MIIDWSEFAEALLEVRDDNVVSIALRRGNTTLPAQNVRIAKGTGRASAVLGGGIEQINQSIVILGDTALDIRSEDRFTLSGVLYEVTAVRPNRRAAVIADGRMVQ